MLKPLVVLLSIALAGIGASMVFAELRRVYRARVWPTVTGQVLRSDSSAGAGDSGSASYQLHIEYQYSVGGQPYKASRDVVGPVWSLAKAQRKAQELRQSYPAGHDLQIAYNPKRPGQSEIGDNLQQQTNYGILLVGMLFAGVFSIVTYYAAGW